MNANITLLEEYIVDDASFVYVCMSLRNKCVHIYKYVLSNENYRKLNLLHFRGVILICMKVLQFFHNAFVFCTMQYCDVILNTFDIYIYIIRQYEIEDRVFWGTSNMIVAHIQLIR